MTDDMTWTPPRSLTFFERIRLTWALFSVVLAMPVVWLTVVWSSGAIVSFHLTDPKSASLRIVSGNGLKELAVTVRSKRVTAV